MVTATSLIVCFIATLVITPLVKRFAIKIGATDQPSNRKVHQKVMARIGGLAIFISFIIGLFIAQPQHPFIIPIVIGALIITLTGFLDDLFELSAKWKLLGQIAAAVVVVAGGVHIEFINLPFDYQWQLGWLSIPLTLLWIIGITNAINLIDGLDGLAAGVSSIILLTITAVAVIDQNVFVMALGAIMLGSTLGFLVHNFNPAKLFMGDTGALFLGFMISVIALLGFKNITVFSLLVPVILLAVPISDTFFAIIRRIVNKTPLSTADKSHLHHCLLNLGFSHKQTVLMIYAMSAIFGLSAIVLTISTLWVTAFVAITLFILIELGAEKVGLVNQEYKPFTRFFHRLGGSLIRR
ncbi:UDP-GlcNAc:undecaprenyl-phosphate GlcNAc-1-phosphate transferase [Geomicrobium halophilum]|uniref:UDP-GlcNAc:undecaprenyl-phosphate GlcNAc-1-phosphate transferase n=1 Tax=Geomicrobium halophilum TaxID=549000 RepID=A0A841PNI3_9BACL|nr:MraY family glycosyltransferase [Geomicrobium halophilum]MBB6450397.1 UDP-GlcNAc:undecaprenyl-phosphate GlcNAc-1-phosphate transferase [Geomicrobium halophilum]